MEIMLVMNGWRYSDVGQFHGAALVWHIRYAGFLKLIVIFLSQFSPEHNEHMFIFVFFPKSDERHKFELFYRRVTILRDGFQTDYHWEGRQNDVTARFVDHFGGSIQLSTQNNIKLERLSLIVR